MWGADVWHWQVFLKTRKFKVPADGYYSPATRRATRLLQKQWKIRPDGTVNNATIKKAAALGYYRTVGLNQKATRPSNATLRSNVVSYFYSNHNLNFPASARIESIKLFMRQDGTYSANLNIRAKNRSGEFRPSYYTYNLDAKGKVMSSDYDI